MSTTDVPENPDGSGHCQAKGDADLENCWIVRLPVLAQARPAAHGDENEGTEEFGQQSPVEARIHQVAVATPPHVATGTTFTVIKKFGLTRVSREWCGGVRVCCLNFIHK